MKKGVHAMPERRSEWTRPGAIDGTVDAEDARKGTAAADPVLVVAPAGEVADVTRTANGNGRGPRRDKAGTEAGAEAETPRDTRTPAEIEADLGRTRERLTETLNELSERLSPRDLARRGGRRVKARFVDEQSGRLRPVPAAAVLGGLGAALGALVALRKARGRSR